MLTVLYQISMHICFSHSILTEEGSNNSDDEIRKPIKKQPLAEARQATYQAEQDHKFESMMALLEGQHHQQQQQHQLEVDLDVDAFVNGIAFSLQKSSGQQCEQLFTEIRNLIYDTLYPKHATAPRPCPIQ